MNPLIQLKKATQIFFVALTCFGLTPATRAVSPPPDGGYPSGNTAEGTNALLNLTRGFGNTATGENALRTNAIGNSNTADGFQALFSNTFGDLNTGIGTRALFSNRIGNINTAIGSAALFSNTTGNKNTATGHAALQSNTTGGENTASGFSALVSNTSGQRNTGNGAIALFKNTTGSFNTAIGNNALFFNSVGNKNTAVGVDCFPNSVGDSFNIGLGVGAGQNVIVGSNNIEIGNEGVFGDEGTIRIGTPRAKGGSLPEQTRAFIAGIYGVTTGNANAIPVLINSAGQLGTASSSARFKKEIKPMDKASEAILRLKPVTFHYRSDSTGTPQFGLIAEEVAEANPDLVVRDENGEIYTVRYDAVNAMLLNEFLKEHQTVQELKKQVAELTAGLQKVSEQLELNKPAPKTVLNNR